MHCTSIKALFEIRAASEDWGLFVGRRALEMVIRHSTALYVSSRHVCAPYYKFRLHTRQRQRRLDMTKEEYHSS